MYDASYWVNSPSANGLAASFSLWKLGQCPVLHQVIPKFRVASFTGAISRALPAGSDEGRDAAR